MHQIKPPYENKPGNGCPERWKGINAVFEGPYYVEISETAQ